MEQWLTSINFVYKRFFTESFRQLIRDSSWTYAATAVTVGLQLLETIMVARFLGVEQYGVFVLIASYPEVILQFLDFRVREAMTKYLAEFMLRDEKAQAVALVKLLWLLDVGTGLLAFLIVVFTAALAIGWLNLDEVVKPLIITYSFGLFFASLDGASGSVLRVFDRFAWAFWLSSIGNLARFGLLLAAVFWGQSLVAIVWARAVSELIMTGLLGSASFIVLKRHLWPYRKSRLKVLETHWRGLAGFMFHTNFAATFKAAVSKLDVLILGFFIPASTVGVYKIASKFAQLLLLISDPLVTAVLPNFIRQYNLREFKGLLKLAWRTSVLITPIALLGALILGVAAEPLITLTVGPSFLMAVTPLRIMLVGIIFAVAFIWVRPTLIVLGRADLLSLIGFVTNGIQLTLLWYFASRWGAVAGAVGLSVQFILYVGLELFFLWRIYQSQSEKSVNTPTMDVYEQGHL